MLYIVFYSDIITQFSLFGGIMNRSEYLHKIIKERVLLCNLHTISVFGIIK